MPIVPEKNVFAAAMDDGGLVLLNETTGKVHRCNLTAATMWAAMLDFHGDSDAAVRAVASYYQTDLARVRGDLDVLVGTLVDAGLVTVDR